MVEAVCGEWVAGGGPEQRKAKEMRVGRRQEAGGRPRLCEQARELFATQFSGGRNRALTWLLEPQGEAGEAGFGLTHCGHLGAAGAPSVLGRNLRPGLAWVPPEDAWFPGARKGLRGR